MTETAAIEAWKERAAIIEYEAGMSRIKAESLALREVAAEFGQAEAAKVQAHRNGLEGALHA